MRGDVLFWRGWLGQVRQAGRKGGIVNADSSRKDGVSWWVDVLVNRI